ncbi:MAG TPA: TIGR02453 family protein [Acidimicrobiia bacterium]|nr:TIGR02453 family protein [Acidimicrobiia bacterium]
MGSRYFTPATFRFLRELAANNEKTWWEENKDRYVSVIREPALAFIADLGARLTEISPHLTADTRANGGSLMRPYRDMRFAKGAPYKENVGIQFRHEAGADIHAPGFYVHIEPGQSFAGAGIWRPPSGLAGRIRMAIHDDPAGWRKAARTALFTDTWNLAEGEETRLKRIPSELRGGDHPFPEDLRLKSFTAGSRLTQRLVTSAGLVDELADRFERAAPYTRFLCNAIGVSF